MDDRGKWYRYNLLTCTERLFIEPPHREMVFFRNAFLVYCRIHFCNMDPCYFLLLFGWSWSKEKFHKNKTNLFPLLKSFFERACFCGTWLRMWIQKRSGSPWVYPFYMESDFSFLKNSTGPTWFSNMVVIPQNGLTFLCYQDSSV